jgi:hypothetical protein
MKCRRTWRLLIVAFCLTSALPALGAPAPIGARSTKLEGSASYRTGPARAVKPEGKAKVWLFRGRQELAVKSAEKLREFEKQFPQGLTQVEDRPKEDETRMAAMVLMSYAFVHKDSLVAELPVSSGGSFRFPWDGKEPLTLIVESAATIGSYHMPRYAVTALAPGQPVPSLRIDFGVSHLENHPASGDSGQKAEGSRQ